MRLIALSRVLSSLRGRALLAREGWAADVELLRALLAEARRVDVVPATSAAPPRRRASRARPLRSLLATWRSLLSAPAEPPRQGRGEQGRPPGRGEARGSTPASVPSA